MATTTNILLDLALDGFILPDVDFMILWVSNSRNLAPTDLILSPVPPVHFPSITQQQFKRPENDVGKLKNNGRHQQLSKTHTQSYFYVPEPEDLWT